MAINIKKSKRGTFTKAANERGAGVQEFASRVLANKDNYSPAMVKKANFARNAAKWEKELGGDLSNLLPLLDFAVPGLGSGLSFVTSLAGSKKPANLLNKASSPMMQNGGKLGDPDPKIKPANDLEYSKALRSYLNAYMNSPTGQHPDNGMLMRRRSLGEIQDFNGASDKYQMTTKMDTTYNDGLYGLLDKIFQGKPQPNKISATINLKDKPKPRDPNAMHYVRNDFLENEQQYMNAAGMKNPRKSNPMVSNRAHGGMLKQYNAPMHNKGGQLVDINGNPTATNPVAEVEGRENTLIDPSGKNAPYVFSQRLGTANKAAQIMKKMKGDDTINRNGRRVAFENLKRENEALKEMAGGKEMGSYQDGGPLPLHKQLINKLNNFNSMKDATPIYPGGTLPEFTVIANKKGSKDSDSFRLLEHMQSNGDNPAYDLWNKAGRLKLYEGKTEFSGSHTKGGIELPPIGVTPFKKDNLDSRARAAETPLVSNQMLNMFLAEVPHGLQEKKEGIDKLNARTKKDWKKYGASSYYTPGTVEYEAHEVLEPGVRKEHAAAIKNKKVQYFPEKKPFGGGLFGPLNNLMNVPGLNAPAIPGADNMFAGQLQSVLKPSGVEPLSPLPTKQAMPRQGWLPATPKLPSLSIGEVKSNRASNLLPGFITNNQFGPSSNPDATTNSALSELLPNQGTLGSILKGAAYVGSAIDAFQPAEREQRVNPNFTAGDRLFSQTGASFQSLANQALGQANAARQTALSGSRNLGQFMNRQRAISGNTGQALSNISLQQKQYNDQLRMARGQREDMKAGAFQAEQIRKQTADSQNRAMRQDAIANLMNNVNNLGTELQKQDALKQQMADMNAAQQKQFLLDLVTINAQNPNFQLADPAAFKAALDSGDMEQVIRLIKFKQ